MVAELKPANFTALGSIVLGNLAEYLPFILHEIETQPRRRCLLLQGGYLSPQVVSPTGWDQLYRHTECMEEGMINGVAVS
jgi:hypothetical protein